VTRNPRIPADAAINSINFGDYTPSSPLCLRAEVQHNFTVICLLLHCTVFFPTLFLSFPVFLFLSLLYFYDLRCFLLPSSSFLYLFLSVKGSGHGKTEVLRKITGSIILEKGFRAGILTRGLLNMKYSGKNFTVTYGEGRYAEFVELYLHSPNVISWCTSQKQEVFYITS